MHCSPPTIYLLLQQSALLRSLFLLFPIFILFRCHETRRTGPKFNEKRHDSALNILAARQLRAAHWERRRRRAHAKYCIAIARCGERRKFYSKVKQAERREKELRTLDFGILRSERLLMQAFPLLEREKQKKHQK